MILIVVLAIFGAVWYFATRPVHSVRQLGPPLWYEGTGQILTWLPATGRELFTPPLVVGQVYWLTLTGTYEVYFITIFGRVPKRETWRRGLVTGQFDAVYHTDNFGNFVSRHDRLSVDDVTVQSGKLFGFVESRAAHSYGCLLEGSGRPVAIKLYPPWSGRSEGKISVTLSALPADYPSPSAQRRAEEAVAAQQAAEQALIEKEEAELAAWEQAEADADQRRAEEWRQTEARIAELKRQVHQQRNFFDPIFRLHFVRKHQQQLLWEWRQQWEDEYHTLMRDADFATALEYSAPEVKEFYERRLEMILEAERLEVLPMVQTMSISAPLPLTARTIPVAQHSVEMLFSLRQEHSKVRQAQVEGTDSSTWAKLDRICRLMAFHLDELRRFGINAASPKEAEEQFQQLLPKPKVEILPPDYYDTVRQKLLSGERISADSLFKQLEDLHREEIILQARRRAAIRAGKSGLREEIDNRLSRVRQEFALSKAALEKGGIRVELPDYREREVSREEQFRKLLQERDNMTSALIQHGDAEGAEHLKALFAEELARLFQNDETNYT